MRAGKWDSGLKVSPKAGLWVNVSTEELVSGLMFPPESWTRAGHLFREKYSANTRELGLLVRYLQQRAPCCIFFIETDPTRHIVLCLVWGSPRVGETDLGPSELLACPITSRSRSTARHAYAKRTCGPLLFVIGLPNVAALH